MVLEWKERKQIFKVFEWTQSKWKLLRALKTFRTIFLLAFKRGEADSTVSRHQTSYWIEIPRTYHIERPTERENRLAWNQLSVDRQQVACDSSTRLSPMNTNEQARLPPYWVLKSFKFICISWEHGISQIMHERWLKVCRGQKSLFANKLFIRRVAFQFFDVIFYRSKRGKSIRKINLADARENLKRSVKLLAP